MELHLPDQQRDATNGAHSPINDAHHFGSVVHDMYNTWLGAPPLSFSLVMNVHYGRNYENAFWNGSSTNFGDGARYFYPLTFNAGACGVANAADDYGYSRSDVVTAFKAVGVTCQ